MRQNKTPTSTLARTHLEFDAVKDEDQHVPFMALEEVWESIASTALVTYLKPGSTIWLQLASVLGLPSTTTFQIGVAVSPGSTWNKELQNFALEIVRVLADPSDPSVLPPARNRARVFRYPEPVRARMLRHVSPIIPDLPCIEVLRVDQQVSIDVRGVHNIDVRLWQEEILLLLKGVALITRADSLSESQLRYETEISAAIEAMAKQNRHKSVPARFTKTEFREHWPFRMSRTNLYNVVPEDRWPDIERRYYHRCKELRSTSAEEA
jgi:hypothetical protein